MYRDTVWCDTPAIRATSVIVGRRFTFAIVSHSTEPGGAALTSWQRGGKVRDTEKVIDHYLLDAMS
jgi:hypothetical protein